MVTANNVADYFLAFCNKHGDLLTNLKLQKLVYYAQAWHLAVFAKPIFQEDCKAWVHGPVFLTVYHRFKDFRWNPISFQPEKLYRFNHNPKTLIFSDEMENFLFEILKVFGNESAYELERMTHNELPWIKARNGIPIDEPSDAIISKADMQVYYSNL